MFYLSWRQLMARKKQSFLILLGISFGTLLFVSISGVQLGLRQYIFNQLLNNTAHILISSSDKIINEDDVRQRLFSENTFIHWIVEPSGKRKKSQLQNYQGWAEILKRDENVFGFVPRLNVNAMLNHGDFSQPVSLVGTIADKQMKVTAIESYMSSGSFSELRGGGNKIVIGKKVAENLGVKIGQIIQVDGGGGSRLPFKVVGLVSFGNEQIDSSVAYAALANVQTLARAFGRISEIAVGLYNSALAESLAQNWQELSQDKVQDWKKANAVFMEMIKVQDIVRYFITSAILIVAAFGIYNVLTIMINQKRREIAILRSIGYHPNKILELILYQGLVLGVSGGLFGIFCGFILCLWIETIDIGIEIGGSHHLLVSYDTTIYGIAFVAAIVASTAASLIPAWEASRLTPMEIIRSES